MRERAATNLSSFFLSCHWPPCGPDLCSSGFSPSTAAFSAAPRPGRLGRLGRLGLGPREGQASKERSFAAAPCQRKLRGSPPVLRLRGFRLRLSQVLPAPTEFSLLGRTAPQNRAGLACTVRRAKEDLRHRERPAVANRSELGSYMRKDRCNMTLKGLQQCPRTEP